MKYTSTSTSVLEMDHSYECLKFRALMSELVVLASSVVHAELVMYKYIQYPSIEQIDSTRYLNLRTIKNRQ